MRSCASRAAIALLALTLAIEPAHAHLAAESIPGQLWTSWNPEWWLWLSLGLAGWLYARGVHRLWRAATPNAGITRLQVSAFAIGWLVLVIALLSPLDAMGGALFSAHMVQHELLMIVAAPLLVLGHPLGPWIWSLPVAWRKLAADLCRESGVRAAVRLLTRPLVASSLSVLALWIWHVPALFDAALRSEWLHALQHASFFVSSLLFWWAVLQRRRAGSNYALGVFYVFAAGMQSSLLGALLAFANTAWYQPYAMTTQHWTLTPLEDQQLGGLIMWIPGGFVYLAIALVLTGAWMRASQVEPGISRQPS